VAGDADTTAGTPASAPPTPLCLVEISSRVVIADADAARRAALLDGLTQKLPASTVFLEAATVTRVLEHARGSRMVVIGGALHEVPTTTLKHILERHCPGVQVVDVSRSTSTYDVVSVRR
jgi:hypothetical protein